MKTYIEFVADRLLVALGQPKVSTVFGYAARYLVSFFVKPRTFEARSEVH